MHDINDKNTTLTPLSLIKKLGVFDYDPCGIKSHKTANKIVSLPEDGLLSDWEGRVWLNPPYSNPTQFMEKLANHGNGIALVLNSTDTNWFQNSIRKASGMLLLKGRPKFMRLDMSQVSIMRGVVLFAFGESNAAILKECSIEGFYINLNNL